jgi:hypothetical protein
MELLQNNFICEDQRSEVSRWQQPAALSSPYRSVRLTLQTENGQKTAPLSCSPSTCLTFCLVSIGKETFVTSAYVAECRTSNV